jgi:hypothetical protein
MIVPSSCCFRGQSMSMPSQGVGGGSRQSRAENPDPGFDNFSTQEIQWSERAPPPSFPRWSVQHLLVKKLLCHCCAMNAGMRGETLFSKLSNFKIVACMKSGEDYRTKHYCPMHAGIRQRLHFATSTIIKLFYTGCQMEITCSYISQVHSATIIDPKIVALCTHEMKDPILSLQQS